MRPLRFERLEIDGLYAYRYMATEGPVVERHWPGLFRDPDSEDRDSSPYYRFNVNNNNMEEIVVYLGFVWALTQPRNLVAIPRYFRDQAEQCLGRPPELVSWEYDVSCDEGAALGDTRVFIPARASYVLGDERGRDRGKLAGAFAIESLPELRQAHRATLSDATAELNVFALQSPARVDELVAGLRGERPRLKDLLRSGEIFIDVVTVVDLGYGDDVDALLVQAVDDIGEEVDSIAATYDRAVASYEADVDRLASMPDFFARLELLQQGKVAA